MKEPNRLIDSAENTDARANEIREFGALSKTLAESGHPFAARVLLAEAGNDRSNMIKRHKPNLGPYSLSNPRFCLDCLKDFPVGSDISGTCITLSDKEFQEEMQRHFDDESHKHMVQTESINYDLEWYFRRFAMSPEPMALTWKQVQQLSIYKKILLMEHLVAKRHVFERHLPNDFAGFVDGIVKLLSGIDKRGFWCGDEDCIYPVREKLNNGFMERNGIKAFLTTQSHFSNGVNPSIHFEGNFNYYPEESPIRCNTRPEDFSCPPDAEFEIVKAANGEVIIRIFVKEMPDSPVLEWTFPSAANALDDVYKEFVAGL